MSGLALAAMLLAAPAIAQAQDPHAGHHMPEPAPDPHSGHDDEEGSVPADPHSGHVMPEAPPRASDPPAVHDDEDRPAPADPHAGHVMESPSGGEAPVGNQPPPAPPADRAADSIWGAGPMAAARHRLDKEAGAFTGSMLLVDLLEYRARDGRDGYGFEGEAWFGGDLNRLVVKAEGEGEAGGSLTDLEGQILFSRAIDPWFNLQAGVRHDFRPQPRRTYGVLGVEGLAPYWLHVGAALFLSTEGELLGRVEGSYDQRLTQRLILQPRAELNFAAQDVEEAGVGSGLSDVELGLRLRCEFAREFAPYAGIQWSKRLGDTARFARAEGEDPDSLSFVLGLRFWF